MTILDSIPSLLASPDKAEGFLRATRGGLEGLSTEPASLLLWALLAVGESAALVAGATAIRYLLRSRSDRAAFADVARHAGLTEAESRLLGIIARLAGLKHPQNVMGMQNAFAHGADALLASPSVTSLDAAHQDAARTMMASLRRKLGHDPVTPAANRRRFARASLSQPAMIARYDFSEESSALDAPRFMPATLTEIAGPGLVMKIPIRLSVGQRALVVVQLQDGRVARGLASVRRAAAGEGDGPHEIALEMLGLGSDDVALLARQSLPRLDRAEREGVEPAMASFSVPFAVSPSSEALQHV